MKVSQITVKAIAEYLRLDDDVEAELLRSMLTAAVQFVQSYTGLTPEEIDQHEDFYIVILILCQDMYDNRVMYVDKNNLNRVVETILGMHRKNFLGTVEESDGDVH